MVQLKTKSFPHLQKMETVLESQKHANSAEARWNSKKAVPHAQNADIVLVLYKNDKIYIIGGVAENWTYLKTVDEYDPLADTWAIKAEMNIKRAGSASCFYNNKIYVFGGVMEGYVTTDLCEVYDPQQDS